MSGTNLCSVNASVLTVITHSDVSYNSFQNRLSLDEFLVLGLGSLQFVTKLLQIQLLKWPVIETGNIPQSCLFGRIWHPDLAGPLPVSSKDNVVKTTGMMRGCQRDGRTIYFNISAALL